MQKNFQNIDNDQSCNYNWIDIYNSQVCSQNVWSFFLSFIFMFHGQSSFAVNLYSKVDDRERGVLLHFIKYSKHRSWFEYNLILWTTAKNLTFHFFHKLWNTQDYELPIEQWQLTIKSDTVEVLCSCNLRGDLHTTTNECLAEHMLHYYWEFGVKGQFGDHWNGILKIQRSQFFKIFLNFRSVQVQL